MARIVEEQYEWRLPNGDMYYGATHEYEGNRWTGLIRDFGTQIVKPTGRTYEDEDPLAPDVLPVEFPLPNTSTFSVMPQNYPPTVFEKILDKIELASKMPYQPQSDAAVAETAATQTDDLQEIPESSTVTVFQKEIDPENRVFVSPMGSEPTQQTDGPPHSSQPTRPAKFAKFDQPMLPPRVGGRRAPRRISPEEFEKTRLGVIDATARANTAASQSAAAARTIEQNFETLQEGMAPLEPLPADTPTQASPDGGVDPRVEEARTAASLAVDSAADARFERPAEEPDCDLFGQGPGQFALVNTVEGLDLRENVKSSVKRADRERRYLELPETVASLQRIMDAFYADAMSASAFVDNKAITKLTNSVRTKLQQAYGDQSNLVRVGTLRLIVKDYLRFRASTAPLVVAPSAAASAAPAEAPEAAPVLATSLRVIARDKVPDLERSYDPRSRLYKKRSLVIAGDTPTRNAIVSHLKGALENAPASVSGNKRYPFLRRSLHDFMVANYGRDVLASSDREGLVAEALAAP